MIPEPKFEVGDKVVYYDKEMTVEHSVFLYHLDTYHYKLKFKNLIYYCFEKDIS